MQALIKVIRFKDEFAQSLRFQAAFADEIDLLYFYKLLWPFEKTPKTLDAVKKLGKPSEQELVDEYDYFVNSYVRCNNLNKCKYCFQHKSCARIKKQVN